MVMPVELPPITITARDHERLTRIASAFVGRSPDSPDMGLTLVDELDRARIVDPSEVPPDVVTMNSRVEFYFDGDKTGRRVVTLVYPGEQDIAEGRISVHTPVGIALPHSVRLARSVWEGTASATSSAPRQASSGSAVALIVGGSSRSGR